MSSENVFNVLQMGAQAGTFYDPGAAVAATFLYPVEDPVAAAVLGGSPERVLATLVGGEDRYRRGTTVWRDLTRAARRARSRMLT